MGYNSEFKGLTSALDGGEWSMPRPDRITPGKETRYPLYVYRRQGGPQGWSGRVRKFSPSPVVDTRTAKPVASHYTNWAIPAYLAGVNGEIYKYDRGLLS